MRNKTAEVSMSLVWKLLERGGVQITQFIVSIIIARLLLPDAYGAVALITVFINIATVFVQSGLSTALIQKKNADSRDFSSIFYYSLTLATVIYFILFFSAESISKFYNMPELTSLIKVMSLTLFPGAINSIQIAFLSKRMEFKKQFIGSFTSVFLSGIIGIVLALNGCGAWSLVFQQLSYQFIVCIAFFFLAEWRPTLEFSFSRTKSMLGFGSKLLGARLIDTIYHNLESIIIGKKYSSATLAYCNKGKMFPLTLIDNIDGAIQSVMLPAYSSHQDNKDRIKAMLRKTISLSTYLVFPALLGLCIVGKSLILVVLGKSWVEAVPYLQLYCLVAMLFPLQTANLQAINAIGRSDVYLKLMVIKRSVGVVLLFLFTMIFDKAIAIVYACLIIEIVGILINFYPNYKILNYTPWEQIKDIFPNLFLALIMIVPTYFVSLIPIPRIFVLFIQVLIGGAIYLLLSVITRNKNYKEIIKRIKNTLKKKGRK